MKKLFLISILTIFLMQVLSAVKIFKEPLSERITGYKINAVLDPLTKTVTGVMHAFWVNKSAGTVPDVQLHIYLNAFRNSKSTFNKESGRLLTKRESDFGWIDIKSLTDKNGSDLTAKIQFISPDDGNPDDMTVLRIDLPDPVKPGDTLFLKINFESKLPNRIIRTGYNDNFFFVAQWFPKFGVYEPSGMRYSLTGGLLISETDAGEGKKTLTYRAEDIPVLGTA